jgi:hypothetical protein
MLGVAAVGYSVVALELALAGATPMPEPYLRIGDGSYFLWGALFYAPVILAAWLLASGAIYLMIHAFRSTPSFDGILRTLAFASGFGTLGTLVPDLVTSPLRAAGVIDEQAWEASIAGGRGLWFVFTWITLITYVLLFAVGYSLAVKQISAFGWKASVAIGMTGFFVFQGFEYVFIR